MEAVLLMLEAVGIVLVLLWAARGRGDQGLLSWRLPVGNGRMRQRFGRR